MKKFMKLCAIIALILLLIGLALVLIPGSVVGDWMNSGALYDIDENMIFENGYEIFTGDVEKYTLGSGVSNLDIEAGGCAFYFKTSDDDNFYAEAKETGKFQGYVKDDTLFVKTTRTVSEWDDYDECEIILYIPEGYRFEHVDVELGAGLLEMTDIVTAEMDLEVGAGQIKADSLQADACDIEVGMGHLQLAGTILGDVDAKCSMGAIELNLTGSAEEFNYIVEAAVGNVTIDGESYSGLTQDKVIKNSADKNMSVECAMGDIEVAFKD